MLPGPGYFAVAILSATAAHAAVPTAHIVQAAYEREAANDDPKHDKNLEVLSADCSSGKIDHEYLCWVTYTSTIDPAQPLFYDVAAVSETSEGWALKTGLCRR